MEKIREGEKLVMGDFLIEEGWMRNIPSKYTFHAVWRAVESESLERGIINNVRGENSRKRGSARIGSRQFRV